MRGNGKNHERKDRPLNESDGSKVRELEPRLMEKRKKGDIEDEVMKKKREIREI